MTQSSVFIIDDDPAMRDSLLMLLRGEGIRARGFASAIQFLDAVPEEKTACVITDLRMPQMEGTELIRQLTALRGPGWPVIVITGHADVPLAVQLMKAGVVDFIEKPFDPNRILEAVRGCLSTLERQGAESEAREEAASRLATLTPARTTGLRRPDRRQVEQGDRPDARHQSSHRRDLPGQGHAEDAGPEPVHAGPPGTERRRSLNAPLSPAEIVATLLGS
jgi:two-component system, LuxR family, response regulator FixJ